MLKSRSTILQLLLSLTILWSMVSWLLIKRAEIPPQVPLWYTRSWGEAQLAPKIYLWLLPGIAGIIVIVNLVLAKVFYRREKALSQFLIFFSTLVSFLLGLAFFRIVRLIV